ncbi:head-tail adaptor protein [Enterobacter hormaechei]|uniref:phage head completion protein n=1 Tax=Enterobacter hormaechei TaxID=158836 RepID=UPI0032DA3538
MSFLYSGDLNKKIVLQRTENGRGPLGEVLPGHLIDVATVWARAELKSNRKIRTLDQKQVVETWLFTVGPRSDVEIDWKIQWQNGSFTVVAVDRSHFDRVEIKAERDGRHDRAGN